MKRPRYRRPPRSCVHNREMRDKRTKRDLHALDQNGMVVCNPRDREAAHRAEVEGIGTYDRDAVTCRKCLKMMPKRTELKPDA